MQGEFYKSRKKRVLAGVLAGLASKFHYNVSLLRVLFVVFCFTNPFISLLLYTILASILPFKEDKEQEKMDPSHGLKEAERPKESSWFW